MYETNKEMQKCSTNKILIWFKIKRKHCFHNFAFSITPGAGFVKRCCWCSYTATEEEINNKKSKHGKYLSQY
jgi:hypothetical protein